MTYKISTPREFDSLFSNKPADIPFILEEYIDGIILTYDGLIDRCGHVVFAASHRFEQSIMEVPTLISTTSVSTPGQGLTNGLATMVPRECGRKLHCRDGEFLEYSKDVVHRQSTKTPPPISTISPMKKKGPQFTPRPLDLKASTSRGEQLAAFDTGGGTNKAAAEPIVTDSHREFKEQRTIKRF